MSKGERISRFVEEMAGKSEGRAADQGVAGNPYYRAYFQCWNAQRYYEAHDVLEQVWLTTDTEDDNFFKGLIQAAGGFVHLQKNYESPAHPKHSRRLKPAVRLFLLAEKNLAPFRPMRHSLDVAGLIELIRATREKIISSDFKSNPWSPQQAPTLNLSTVT